jgi:hypothetical protein
MPGNDWREIELHFLESQRVGRWVHLIDERPERERAPHRGGRGRCHIEKITPGNVGVVHCVRQSQSPLLGYERDVVLMRCGGDEVWRRNPNEGLEFARKIESALGAVLRHDAA